MNGLLAQALAAYRLDGAEAVFLQHNENLTYRVADQYLLRIHTPAPGVYAPSTADDRRAELALLQHLRLRGMAVQQPVPAASGDMVAILPDGTAATLLHWLPGQVLSSKDYTPGLCFAAGEMTFRLHQAAEGFAHPCLRTYDEAEALAKADLLRSMVQRHRLGSEHADILCAACRMVAQSFAASADKPIAIHNDLSASNILQTETGPVPIDFSLCGLGLPMTDLGMLLAGFGSTAQRSTAVRGYQADGGIFRHQEMEAGFIYGLLGALVFHADTWPKEPWFAEKLLPWERMELLPFIEGKPFFDTEMNFIYL